MSTIIVVGVIVFFAGAGWLAKRVGRASPELRDAPAFGGPAWLAAFWIWGLLCLGGVLVAITIATGSPFGLGSSSGADSGSTSTPTSRSGGSSARLVDLSPTADSSGAGSTGSAQVGGEPIANAYLVTAADGPQELDLTLPRAAHQLDLVMGVQVTEAAVTGPRSMEIQAYADRTPLIDEQVRRDRAPLHKTVSLPGAQVLRIVVTDHDASVYDEAVIGGGVRP